MPERLDQKIRAALPRTARFICVSEDTRQAFAAHYRIPLERCDHVPHGVDTKVFHHEVDRRFDRWVRIRYRLPRPFLLFVGAMVPRKDVVTLLNAFALIARQFSDLDVVVAGHKTRRWASDWSLVQEWIREHHELRTRLRVLNYVTARDLPHLYRASEVVTLPSITEGFGLTVLEGFASGKPVVTTRAGAIPEVGGDAAYYAPPKDPEAFAAALTAALRGDDRERRAAEARAIVTAHTWARTWRLTRASYELAAG
jgi:glycosyltransferase involved in cell wall biosynthesis